MVSSCSVAIFYCPLFVHFILEALTVNARYVLDKYELVEQKKNDK